MRGRLPSGICISIHAPREGSDGSRSAHSRRRANFYPRSPRGERRAGRPAARPSPSPFLSTLPARGATSASSKWPRAHTISIHAPREGSDVQSRPKFFATSHFYPRSPRGERPSGCAGRAAAGRFLSTLPARGATRPSFPAPRPTMQFLSTLPARGATRPSAVSPDAKRFLSTLPARGATRLDVGNGLRQGGISIHAPREGSDER